MDSLPRAQRSAPNSACCSHHTEVEERGHSLTLPDVQALVVLENGQVSITEAEFAGDLSLQW